MLLSEALPRRRQRLDRILFVSMHDTSRGPMAAALFNSMANPLLATARSAGFYPGTKMDDLVIQALPAVQLSLSGHRPQRLTAELLRESTVIVHITGKGAPPSRVAGELRWDVPFIRQATPEAVLAVATDLEQRIGRLIAERGWRQSLPCGARA